MNCPLALSRTIGTRVHACVESVRNDSSALSDENPLSEAPTSTDAPFGTEALPGTTRTDMTGVAASASDHGTNSARAVSRISSGPATRSNAATAAAPPSTCSARTVRGRSIRPSRFRGSSAFTVRVVSRAVSDGDDRSSSGACSSCTAERSDCFSSGACSST